ncbi:mitochondrial carrier domain-containing protein [Tribonema minus]|uniref:Mitochondrial carrier domain-containing protein n=1 Tax=Tribonema minus TaxID=303371 RepID=A0A836C9F7_9STRA|nr:mitochondrial carrier domain-containing protein [Tribonema minus]
MSSAPAMEDEAPPRQPTLLQKALASSAGSVITALVTTPLDVVKTRLQTGSPQAIPPVIIRQHQHDGSSSLATKKRHPGMRHKPTSQTWAMLTGHRCLTCGSVIKPAHICFGAEEFRGARRQAAQQPPRATASTMRALLQIGRAEGLRGLYSGLSPTLAMVVPQTVLYFSCYEAFKARLETAGLGQVAAPMAAGGSARVLAVVALAPLELVRTRMQGPRDSGGGGGAPRTLRAALSEAASGGGRALFTGLVPTLWRDVPFSVMYWAGYDTIRRALAARQRRGDGGGALLRRRSAAGDVMAHAFLGGVGAGALATVVTHPFDVVKTRQQLASAPAPPRGAAAATAAATAAPPAERMWPLARRIVQQEGYGALLAGLPARVAKVAPACAIMISSYEGAKHVFAGGAAA